MSRLFASGIIRPPIFQHFPITRELLEDKIYAAHISFRRVAMLGRLYRIKRRDSRGNYVLEWTGNCTPTGRSEMFKIDNGVAVRDRVTGFRGTVTGRVDYLTGCRQYLVQPVVDDEGKHVNAIWLDEDRLEVEAHIPKMEW